MYRSDEVVISSKISEKHKRGVYIYTAWGERKREYLRVILSKISRMLHESSLAAMLLA